MKIEEKIIKRKNEINGVIIAHNYQLPEIQDIADFVGDSLELSRKAKETDADVIIFCGVKFMAETAKILSPEKIVLLPEIDAGCPMADMITADDVRELRKKYPDATIVAYVNTNADVKAEVDICCTSSNAVKVVNSVKTERVIFIPDRNLGSYVKRFTDKEMIIWDGFCPTHNHLITLEDIKTLKDEHPEALVIVHPECTPDVIDIADYVASTSGIIKLSKELNNKEFIIGTEEGIVHRLKKENPEKNFYPVRKAICYNMKKINLNSLFQAIEKLQYRIELEKWIIDRAYNAIEKMIKL
uniref:Quinolinate synthase n=1 Tax=candidate division WOR-3 bacterium TaxID=2052148 RepID=A0A7C4UH69_UNCW3